MCLDLEDLPEPAGPDDVRVELELPTKGDLKHFNRVELEMRSSGKLLLSSSLLPEQRSKPGQVLVVFTADRAQLDKINLLVVVGDFGDVGYGLKVKDFVDLKKLAAEEEEARFLAVVRKAFEARHASGLDALTDWDRMPEKLKKNLQGSYAALVAEKGVVFDFALIDPDLKFVDRDRLEDGVTYRFNLPITKQLEMKAKDTRDNKTLFILTFAVGEKEGKLLLLGSAPVK